MSYARWSYSYWYAFWCTSPTDDTDPILDFCSLCTFKYSELVADQKGCLERLLAACRDRNKPDCQPDPTDIAEAVDVMNQFVADAAERLRELATPARAGRLG